ncbi:MAG: PrsW family intramembrane metalloprotease [Scytolyngbya sp. HA4215-MV1]|jgi:RsiW-degrading membrane proteinase PrsW (M82 family)|nr:PrsW family intramembrane metalloprotease [Scytolyngbya sp. HA4215-MV1]
MRDQFTYRAFLRQLPSHDSDEQSLLCYCLSESEMTTIGRDPRCQIVLDTQQYGEVSRWHAEVRPTNLVPAETCYPRWWICDLNSVNGTYINGERLRGCRILQAGDRIILSQSGPEFLFEYQSEPLNFTPPHSSPVVPVGAIAATARPNQTPPRPESITFSQLFPILSTGQDLYQKAYLLPGAITVGFVVLMFISVGHPIAFNCFLATYLAIAAYYVVYQLCGKHKPWWVILGIALATVLILRSPLLSFFTLIFRQILPGQVLPTNSSDNLALLLMRIFLGAGLMEELIKALPVLTVYLVGRRLRSPWREWIGVWEPLDGILLGTASAVGFTLLETLGQYVPEAIQNVTVQSGQGAGELAGLQLLIPRILGLLAGHVAYSGYLGYFIGLSVLKPGKRWVTLGIGYLSAAGLHTLWNAAGLFSVVLLTLVGIVSYAFLAAAILKARALSPTRSQNFATHFFSEK